MSTAKIIYHSSLPRLTIKRYEDLVEGWNHKRASTRAAIADECKEKDHDWHETPLGGIREEVDVCRRCLRYRTIDIEQ